MDFPTFLIQLLNSVQYGLLLFMLAAGLTLIFGIMGVVNLAHGSFYMLGAYLAWSLSGLFGSLTLAILVGVVLAVGFGLLLEWLLFRHFYQRSHLDQVLLTFGLIYVFEEMRSMLWGDDVHSVKVPDLLGASIPLTDTLSYPIYRLFMSVVCVALALGLYWLISRTRLGMKIRAGAFNRDMAEALAFAAEGKVKADIELQPLSSINQVFERLEHGDVPSRVVLDFVGAAARTGQSAAKTSIAAKPALNVVPA